MIFSLLTVQHFGAVLTVLKSFINKVGLDSQTLGWIAMIFAHPFMFL